MGEASPPALVPGAVRRLSALALPYSTRDRRATELAAEQPHSAELLELYRAVLSLQSPVFEWIRTSRWRKRLQSASDDDPSQPFEGLPVGKLEKRFGRFSAELAASGTDVLSTAGIALAEASARQRSELLRATLERADVDALADSLECETAALAFYSRAFLQAVLEASITAALEDDALENGVGKTNLACPRCGWPPQVAVLRDEAELKSRRLLVCALCATGWSFPRLACPGCDERDTEKLLCHEVESRPHLRIEECQACRCYLKTVDLRRDGTAVPLVEDIASVELDIWAEEKGLRKICPNLLGL